MNAAEWNAKYPNSDSPDPVLVKWWPDRERRPQSWQSTKTTSLAFIQNDQAWIKVAHSKKPVPLASVEPMLAGERAVGDWTRERRR